MYYLYEQIIMDLKEHVEFMERKNSITRDSL
jgi:hypothetical protein